MTTFLTDFRDAIRDYPETGMEITFEDLEQVGNPDGQDVNINEVWMFKVKVRVHGWMDVSDLQVHVRALNGASVSMREDGPWRPGINSAPMTIESGTSGKTELFYFKAPSTAGPATLLEATIKEWNGILDSLLTKQSVGSDTPSEPFSTNVVGN